MYIYAPHIDAFLCYNKSSHRITFEKMENAMVREWENWEQEEDEHGTKRILCMPRHDQKFYLSWTGMLIRRRRFNFLIPNSRPSCNYCYIHDDHLFFKGFKYITAVVPMVQTTFFDRLEDADGFAGEISDATRVEMICMLPHCLK